ncbi:MAG TPA: hypothetical protein VJJ80_03910 [Patescibacteria group bacterium]|nr:hypothetical protein [Patescibacteria group bacterium]
MKKILIIIGIFLMVIILRVAILKMSSPKDDWICQNSQWVKHGHPNQPVPTTICQ